MSKLVTDAALDALLTTAGASTELYLCQGDPGDRAAAIAASLSGVGGAVEAPPTQTGPQDRTGGGRELVYNPLADINIVTPGTAATVVLCDATNLLLKTDLQATVVVDNGDTVDLGAFTHGVGDAA